MRDLVVRLRKTFEPRINKVRVKGISPGSQPLVLWNNRQNAEAHRRYPGGGPEQDRPALERFCSVFPDAFFVADRGPYFDPKAAGQGRPLTAGFHLMQGYFRDDTPLAEMVLKPGSRATATASAAWSRPSSPAPSSSTNAVVIKCRVRVSTHLFACQTPGEVREDTHPTIFTKHFVDITRTTGHRE